MKKRLILALAAVLLAGAASAQTPEYSRALELYGHGMYAEAAQLLERIPAARPKATRPSAPSNSRPPATSSVPKPSWTAGPNPPWSRR